MRTLIFIFAIFSMSILNAQPEAVDSNLMMEHVEYFASPELDGRLPGTVGYEKAVSYSIDYLESLGVESLAPGYWPQRFSMETNIITDANMYIGDPGNEEELKTGVDFSVRGYSGAGTRQSDVIFCGYGFDNGKYNDYKDIDVHGKIVMVFKSNPPFIEDCPRMSIREKADMAYQKGATAIIFVSQPNQENPQKPIGSVMHGDGPMHEDMPQVQVSVEIANRILKGNGEDLSNVQTQIDESKQPYSFNTKTNATVKVFTKYNMDGNCMNIAGVLRGSDPNLRDEYIVVSAHLDHVGSIGDQVYYPGANDNASGSAAVLELARIFSTKKMNLKRSIIFILFGSEEKGLVGSGYLADNFPIATDQIVAMFNMDCIGYGDSIKVGNGKSNPGLWKMAMENDSLYINRTVHSTWGGGGADLTPFHDKGVPGLYFVTTNSYKYLHLPGDFPETLNVGLYTDLVRLVSLLCYDLVIEGAEVPKEE
ncbi:MAG: M20/M25/M40 family metallo-hydrolase [Bacteroidales bacterium]|nr:M20/M25/M40 family metallo-hydrolase [Bacteroidales bacterium]